MQPENFVLMFPGQGSQKAGMGEDIAANFKEFNQTFEEASDILGFNMSALCFQDPDSKLNLTEYTQPAILTFSTGIFRVLRERAGIQARVAAGHSLGEYSALVALNALKFEDALKAVHFRGQAMQRAVPVGVGAMAAYLGTQGDEVVRRCKAQSAPGHIVEVVNFNSPGQLVLSGHKEAVTALQKEISENKLGKAIPLPVSAPFHSSLMQPAAQEMARFLENIPLAALGDATLIANVDAKAYNGQAYTKEHLVKQLASAVLWTQTLQQIGESSEREWIEVGPGAVLQGLLKKTFPQSTSRGTQDAASLKTTLERLGA